jgi:hypothetical protein
MLTEAGRFTNSALRGWAPIQEIGAESFFNRVTTSRTFSSSTAASHVSASCQNPTWTIMALAWAVLRLPGEPSSGRGTCNERPGQRTDSPRVIQAWCVAATAAVVARRRSTPKRKLEYGSAFSLTRRVRDSSTN